jgi:hypothetical protein
MLLTSAQRVVIAAALAEEHDLPIGQAIAFADTAADALRKAGAAAADLVASAAFIDGGQR